MLLGRQQVQLHLPGGLPQTVVVLLRGNSADRVRRMHGESDYLLVRTVGMFDLVVHGSVMLIGEGTLVAVVGVTLASVAGFSQLFSL